MDIHQSDALFRSTPECGNWRPEPGITETQETIGPGHWIVGVQVDPGTYRADADRFCYWARLESFGGTAEEIVEDGFLEAPGAVRVMIEASDAGFFTDDECGPWTRIEEPS